MKFHLGTQHLVADESSELTSKYPELNVYALGEIKQTFENPCVFVQDNLEPQAVVAAVKERGLRHIVQKSKGYFADALASAGRLIQGAECLEKEYCFSEERVSKSLTLTFRSRDDKEDLKKKSMKFVKSLSSPAVTSAGDAIIEELYMNAVIDAPREAQLLGIQVENPVCEMHFCQTENWPQISCTDPYGSLAVGKLISRMDEVYTKGAGQAINMDGTEGAGLGCVLLFEQSACLSLGVQAAQRTKVTCLIPLGISNRQRADMRKSLHWLEK